MPQTYLYHLNHFVHFLTAYTHTVLYLRSLYPRTSFLTARFHNTPIYQSRHPALCTWITDAVAAIRNELLSGTVARIAIVIYHQATEDGRTGSSKVMERYMLDVSRFPVVPKSERDMDIEFAPEAEVAEDSSNSQEKGKAKARPVDADAEVDMSEQFRAALTILTTRCSQLKPLPPNCSFTMAIELKDEADVDPPVGHPQPWIPVQPSLQKTGRRNTQTGVGSEDRESTSSDGRNSGQNEGHDLGGVRTTPIRAVEAGVLRFESWVEEGKAKFDADATRKNSFTKPGV